MARGSRKKNAVDNGDLPDLPKGKGGLYPCPSCRHRTALVVQDDFGKPYVTCGSLRCYDPPSSEPGETVEEAKENWNAFALEEWRRFLQELADQQPPVIKSRIKSKRKDGLDL